jgi:hypothetical protein
MTEDLREPIKGHMVEAEPGVFLDQNMNWRRHSVKATPFVHPKEALIQGGAWVPRAVTVYEGEFNPLSGFSRMGIGRAFPGFISEAVASISKGTSAPA